MKTTKLFITFLAAMGVLLLYGSAQATTFSLNSSFSNIVGEAEKFQWTVTNVSIAPFTLGTGDFRIFTYGRFHTDDFGLDSNDLSDNNDSFKARLSGFPSNTVLSRVGEPDAAKFLWLFDMAEIDFVNEPIFVTYGNGGRYSLTFLDAFLWGDGSVDLRAVLYNRTEPVPEPGTMMLLGTGLLGLVLYGKRRRNA